MTTQSFKLFFLLLLFGISACQYDFTYSDLKLYLSNSVCPVYKCVDDIPSSGPNACKESFFVDSDTKKSIEFVKVKQCSQNSACGSSGQCEQLTDKGNLPGTPCISQGDYVLNSNCVTGHCEDNQCAQPQSIGEYCFTSNWCGDNAVCDRNKCVVPLNIDENCTYDNFQRCPWNTQCLNYTVSNGSNFQKCTQYYSLPDGTILNNIYTNQFMSNYVSTNVQIVCKSMNFYVNKQINSSSGRIISQWQECQFPAKLNGTDFKLQNCSKDSDCVFVDPVNSTLKANVRSTCSGQFDRQFSDFNAQGQRYCYPLDPNGIVLMIPGNYNITNNRPQITANKSAQCAAYKYIQKLPDPECPHVSDLSISSINPVNLSQPNQQCLKYFQDIFQNGIGISYLLNFTNNYKYQQGMYEKVGNNIPVVCNASLTQDYCMIYQNNQFQVNPCPSGYFCKSVNTNQLLQNTFFQNGNTSLANITVNLVVPGGVCIQQSNFSNYYNPQPNATLQFIGKPCGVNSDICQTGYCNPSGVCGFIKNGLPCQSNSQCAKGQQCLLSSQSSTSRTCVLSFTINEECSYETQSFCPVETKCLNVTFSNGTNAQRCFLNYQLQAEDSCQLLNSNPSSTTKSPCPNQICASELQYQVGDTYYCRKYPEKTLGLQWPKRCIKDEDCVGHYYGGSSKCTCNVLNSEGAGFCAGFESELFDFNAKIQYTQQQNSSQCENFQFNSRYGENITGCNSQQLISTMKWKQIYTLDTKFETCIQQLGQTTTGADVEISQELFAGKLNIAMMSFMLITILFLIF